MGMATAHETSSTTTTATNRHQGKRSIASRAVSVLGTTADPPAKAPIINHAVSWLFGSWLGSTGLASRARLGLARSETFPQPHCEQQACCGQQRLSAAKALASRTITQRASLA
ncbi:unnamed protein product [Ectocarpus sp. 13 AM-2016]